MEMLQRLPIPRRVSSRLWLISLPSALLTFERRQRVPPLPIGRLRFLGLPVILAGLGLALRAWRRPAATPVERASVTAPPALARLAGRPGTMAGVLVLAGTAVLLRSLVLGAYSLAIAFAAGTDIVVVEEPHPEALLGGHRRQHD